MIPEGDKIPYPPNQQGGIYDDQPRIYFASALLNPGILIRVNIMIVLIFLVHIGHLFPRLRCQSKATANEQTIRPERFECAADSI